MNEELKNKIIKNFEKEGYDYKVFTSGNAFYIIGTENLPFMAKTKQFVYPVEYFFTGALVDKDIYSNEEIGNSMCRKWQKYVLEHGPFIDENNLVIYLYEFSYHNYKNGFNSNFKDCGFLAHFKKEKSGQFILCLEFGEELKDNGKYTRLDSYFEKGLINSFQNHGVEQVYNFITSTFSNQFDKIITKENGEDIRRYFGMESGVDLAKYLLDSICDNNYAIGVRELEYNYENMAIKIKTFVYLGKSGELISDLFYIIDGELKALPVNEEIYEEILSEILDKEINNQRKKKTVMMQDIKKLSRIPNKNPEE